MEIKYGSNFKFEIKEIEKEIHIKLFQMKKDIKITSIDFGRELYKRQSEGVVINEDEEIDVISGITNEKTTGETIHFVYKNGEISSAIILLGTLAKKLNEENPTCRAREIGGINTDEKNENYIKT